MNSPLSGADAACPPARTKKAALTLPVSMKIDTRRRSRQTAANSFAVVVLLTLWLLSGCQLACQAGINPSNADIRAMLVAAGYKHHIPPMILFAIAWQESKWKQFDSYGNPTTNSTDGGVGIMQMTGSTAALSGYSLSDLETNIIDNIDAGAQTLENKWAGTPVIGDGFGMIGREKLENWYYAIWAYNSWGKVNNPNWTGQPKTNVPPYQSLVYGFIATPPSPLTGMWIGCNLSYPTNAQIGSITQSNGLQGCGQPIANTPSSPYGIHSDADFDGVIDGTPINGTDIYVNGGYSGTQNGTASNPYSTVTAAVNAASATQAVTLHIAPGVYHEAMPLTIRKNIHMVTNGSGTVQIGR